MIEVKINDNLLQQAASEGMDAFVHAFVEAIRQSIGHELTTDTMSQLNADQITLLAWAILHEEVMDGGFVQLIHNGYGPFIFKNPFAKAVKLWGMRDLSKLIYDAHTLYLKHHEAIEKTAQRMSSWLSSSNSQSLMIWMTHLSRMKSHGRSKLLSI